MRADATGGAKGVGRAATVVPMRTQTVGGAAEWPLVRRWSCLFGGSAYTQRCGLGGGVGGPAARRDWKSEEVGGPVRLEQSERQVIVRRRLAATGLYCEGICILKRRSQLDRWHAV